jgi:hypothetical protein
MTNVDKQHAVALLERLDPDQATAAVRFMEFLLLDPVAHGAATAVADDEPMTDQDRARIEAGKQHGSARGKTATMAEVLADFKLTPEDLPIAR